MTHKTGPLLVLAGVAGALFFVATDVRWGLADRWTPGNPIDAANDAALGTLAGIAASAVVVLIGLWLTLRKTV